MASRNLDELASDRERQRKGLTGRGVVGCIMMLLSFGLAYALYWWLEQQYNLRRLFSVPRDWPNWVVTTAAVVLLFIVVQLVMTILIGLIFKLAGRDKKVIDQMGDLYDHWDDIKY